MSEFKITRKIDILETISVLSFCFGATTILYFLMNSLNTKTVNWVQFDDFFVPGASLLLAAVLANKWANDELVKICR